MRGVEITPAKTIENEGWNATTLKLYSHSGTHMDAPVHFLPGGSTMDEHDLNRLIGPAQVIDLAPAQPKQLFGVEDLKPFESKVTPGCRLLLKTDWYKTFGTPQYRDELPRISRELAHWLVEREVALVGVEAPSVADVNNIEELTDVHQILFRGGVVIVESLAYLDQLQSDEVQFIALPLKIMGGDGCPVRAVAQEGV